MASRGLIYRFYSTAKIAAALRLRCLPAVSRRFRPSPETVLAQRQPQGLQ